ncbi:glutamine--fructose-6-phosphate transaminase [Anaerobacterium chartisolvens]|uniref:Glutamine--fructose-6-phosphate transaminase n=1 Tax=Anaerobacterium chartisolvens TaxID=1297424 RepID=A0A369AYG3_9FIRM|nr:SIS domain-containing protein [Anaerobacterium chartisolvens]RCX13226.1 glutamine--fructose-6-phosphate transaminase [Anaerobacterium chartisolvens]
MTKMWNEIMEQPQVLGKCMGKNKNAIDGITEEIKRNGISSVVIAARGTSDHAAVYAKYIIEILTGVPVSLAAPSVFTMYGKEVCLKNSLVIGISQSGKAADAIEVITSANRQGALTVSVTNFPDSPMAVEAKYHLFCDCGIEKSVAATKTFTAQMYLIAQLVAKWSGNEELLDELSRVPENMTETFKEEKSVMERVERYRFMKECFVLARGVNYSIAMESALKIQETTYVRAKAYATSDFYHGPFAMIEKDMPVLVFAPDGPSLKDVEEMMKRLVEREAELIVISNKPELGRMGSSFFRIPKSDNDLITPFYNVAVAQMFACRLALTKGLNPDSPRGLNKVTITR